MQQKFEQFILAHVGIHYNLKKSGDSYCDSFINTLWMAFKAGAENV